MKVILREDLENLGIRGEIVTVKDGYARNFLIPRGLAVIANKGNARAVEEETRQASLRIVQAKGDAQAIAERLKDVVVRIPARVGAEDRIFGTITTQQIADGLKEHGVEVDRRRIELREDIRTLGVYRAQLKLHSEVPAEVKVEVVASVDEAGS